MSLFKLSKFKKMPIIGTLCVLQLLPFGCNTPPLAGLQTPLTQQDDNFTGNIAFATEKPTPFSLKGSEPDLGDYTATGEVTFHEGATPGSLIGDGVAVFETTDGSKIVAVVTWPVEAGGDMRSSDIQFRWRDSIQFSDGTTADSTGRFEDPNARPPGLVVIAIIAILIGLLVPAVQRTPCQCSEHG